MTEVPIYRDALAEGWRDDGWGVRTNLAATEERLSGTSAIAARFITGWSAVRLRHDPPLTRGYTVGNILGQIDGWLATYRPDVVLLMAGTNDLAWWNVEGPEATAARLGALLDRIRQRSPQTTVIVASIPPMKGTTAPNNRPREELGQAYNAAIRRQVEQRVGQGAPLAFADVHAILTVGDLYDDVHPTEAAHNRIADVWYDALRATLR